MALDSAQSASNAFLYDERIDDGWQLTESLESNALVLYEFTPLVPLEAETEEIHSPR